jgi:hypothetical protein
VLASFVGFFDVPTTATTFDRFSTSFGSTVQLTMSLHPSFPVISLERYRCPGSHRFSKSKESSRFNLLCQHPFLGVLREFPDAFSVLRINGP